MQASQGVWICSTTQNQISEISHAEKVLTEDKMQVLTCSFSAVLYCSLLFGFALSKGIFVFSLRQGYPLQNLSLFPRIGKAELQRRRQGFLFRACQTPKFSCSGLICCGLTLSPSPLEDFWPHFPLWDERGSEDKKMMWLSAASCTLPGGIGGSAGPSPTILTMDGHCKGSYAGAGCSVPWRS